MRRFAAALIIGFVVAGGIAWPEHAAGAGPIDALAIDGALGDPLSEGLQAVYLAPESTLDQVGTSPDHTAVSLTSSEGWDLTFAAPGGATLVPGTYHAGLTVERDGHDCEPWAGEFTVQEIGWGAGGAVETFSADVQFACYPHPAMFGSVRLASSVPVRALAVDDLDVRLPSTEAGTPGAAGTVTVTNIGPTTVTLGAAGIRAVNDDSEVVDDACEGTLAPAASCTVDVRLTGANIGLDVSSTLELPDDTPRGMRSVRVGGDVMTDTTTTIAFSPTSRYWPNHSIVTATVTPEPLGGTVTFRYETDGEDPVETTIPVSPSGEAGIQWIVPRGDHTWTATYNGDGAWRSSSSTPTPFHTGLMTHTQLRAEVNPVTAGSDVVLHAEVAPGAAVPLPAGTLTIRDDEDQVVASGPVGGATTELVTTIENLPLGQHDYTATYASSEDGSPSQGVTRVFVRTHGIEEQWTATVPMASGTMWIEAVATSPDAVYLAGTTEGVVEGQASKGLSDAVVARLDPATGDVVWARQLGSDGFEHVRDLAVTDQGVYVSGTWAGAPFVAALSLGGTERWVRQSPRDGDGWLAGAAPDGGVYVGSRGANPGAGSGSVGQVRRYAPDGTLRWERNVTAFSVEIAALASDPGGLTVGGWARGSVATGIDDQEERGWVRRLSPSGATLWTRELDPAYGAAVTQQLTTNEVGIFASGTSQSALPGLPDQGGNDQRWLRHYRFDGSVASTTIAAREGSVPACDAVVARATTEALPSGAQGGRLAQLGPGTAVGWTFERPGLPELSTVFKDLAIRPGHAYVIEERLPEDPPFTDRILALEGVPPAPGCDTTPPKVAAPSVAFPVGTTAGSTVPVRLRWTATDLGGSVARSELRRRVNGGATSLVDDGVAGLARRVDLVPGRDYRFRVRAFDHAGNASAPAWGPTMGLRRIDDDAAAIRYSSGWKTVQAGSASGGTVHRSSARGATARITVTGRAFAWVAPTGPSRGSAEVRVDGRLVATVSLRSASSEPRRVVWSRAWAASGRHTIEIRVKGTSGHPAVAIDGFLVLD